MLTLGIGWKVDTDYLTVGGIHCKTTPNPAKPIRMNKSRA